MTDNNASTTWPPARGDRDAFVAEFGEDLANRFQQAFWTVDPVADALFTSGHSVKEIMPNLRDALHRGEANDETFPEVAEFIEDMKKALDGIDAEKFERGRRVYLSIPPLVHGVAVGPGSLIHTYSTPAIADLLVNTGELTVGAIKRLAYTTNWTYSLYLPDSIQPGNVGFVHSGMVRAMHAHVRRVHNNRGFDYTDWGAPINELDMFRTWFDFTSIPYKALEDMGWKLTKEEQQDIYYLWQVVGRMIGINSDLMEGMDDMESSQRTLVAVHFVDGEPNENSQALVDSLMSGFVVNVNELTGLPKESLKEWTEAYARIMHGDEVCDGYNIPRTTMQPILEMNIPAVAERFELLRANPEALDKEIATNEQIIREVLDDQNPSYLKQDDGIKTADDAA